MDESHVVTCFIEHQSKVLILCRSQQVGTYRRRWAGISGYVEPGVSPLEQALQECSEEAGLAAGDLQLVKAGLALEIYDHTLNKKWVVHPFRFLVDRKERIKTDWEHTDCRWVDPEEIKHYETVPGLYDAWERVK